MLLVFFLGVLGVGVGVGAWFWISQDLPRIERLADYRPPAVTQVLAHDGQLMAEFYRERRYVVPVQDVSRLVVTAFVSAEDGDFFRHPGIDLWGITRAAWANLKARKVVQGGSTITQQVAKTLLLTPQRTFGRKIKEMILAWRIERYLNKEEILYLYLNQIYLGNGAYGVEAAAQTYFGKHARDLDVAEAALLAGLVQAPSRYSPLRHPRRARARQVYVIERMVADHHITPAQAEEALNAQLNIRLHRPDTVPAAYYEETVRQWLEEKFGANTLYEGGLTVQTACDPGLTKAAIKALEQGLTELTNRHGFQGPVAKASPSELQAASERPVSLSGLEPEQVVTGLVTQVHKQQQTLTLRMGSERGQLTLADLRRWQSSLKDVEKMLTPGDIVRVRAVKFQDKTKTWDLALVQEPVAQAAVVALEAGSGRCRVLIGGRSFSQSQYNRAIQAHRQPGSAFKPFIYAAALDRPQHPYTPASILIDSPVVYEDPSQPDGLWRPKNYEADFKGLTTFRESLEHSRNIPTVKLLADLGVDYAIRYARQLGISSELPGTLSLALGSGGVTLLEMTRAYSVFANQGRLVDPVLVEKVFDRDGKTIYQANPDNSREVISPQTAFVMTSLLKGVVENGTGRSLRLPGRSLAGKTGTTNDLRDAWFIGYAPSMVCGVWVGRDENESLGSRETGARAAGPIWKEFMKEALAGLPPIDFPVPQGVVFARVHKESGQALPTDGGGGYFEAFKAGSEPGVAPPTPLPHSRASEAEDFLQSETFATQDQE
ncbi:MAG: PBP1A family penicillin-binding protein [Desulfarculus sp.]|nr:PBP1A family penicillin-binding protein [Desulfarculus sp.]